MPHLLTANTVNSESNIDLQADDRQRERSPKETKPQLPVTQRGEDGSSLHKLETDRRNGRRVVIDGNEKRIRGDFKASNRNSHTEKRNLDEMAALHSMLQLTHSPPSQMTDGDLEAKPEEPAENHSDNDAAVVTPGGGMEAAPRQHFSSGKAAPRAQSVGNHAMYPLYHLSHMKGHQFRGQLGPPHHPLAGHPRPLHPPVSYPPGRNPAGAGLGPFISGTEHARFPLPYGYGMPPMFHDPYARCDKNSPMYLSPLYNEPGAHESNSIPQHLGTHAQPFERTPIQSDSCLLEESESCSLDGLSLRQSSSNGTLADRKGKKAFFGEDGMLLKSNLGHSVELARGAPTGQAFSKEDRWHQVPAYQRHCHLLCEQSHPYSAAHHYHPTALPRYPPQYYPPIHPSQSRVHQQQYHPRDYVLGNESHRGGAPYSYLPRPYQSFSDSCNPHASPPGISCKENAVPQSSNASEVESSSDGGAPEFSPSTSGSSSGKRQCGSKKSQKDEFQKTCENVSSLEIVKSSMPSISTVPSTNKCVTLRGPIPSKFWGDIAKAKDAYIPAFDQLVNYPDYLPKNLPNSRSMHHQSITPLQGQCEGNGTNGRFRNCVMCGKTSLCTASSSSSVEQAAIASALKKQSHSDLGTHNRANGESSGATCTSAPIIPRQNKGLCTNCDVTIWVVVKTGLEIKWCKGCKNFRPWAAFGEKGLATKCVKCRERQKEKYAAQKETVSSNTRSTNTASASDDEVSSGKRKFSGDLDNTESDDGSESMSSKRQSRTMKYLNDLPQTAVITSSQRKRREAKEKNPVSGLSHLLAATNEV